MILLSLASFAFALGTPRECTDGDNVPPSMRHKSTGTYSLTGTVLEVSWTTSVGKFWIYQDTGTQDSNLDLVPDKAYYITTDNSAVNPRCLAIDDPLGELVGIELLTSYGKDTVGLSRWNSAAIPISPIRSSGLHVMVRARRDVDVITSPTPTSANPLYVYVSGGAAGDTISVSGYRVCADGYDLVGSTYSSGLTDDQLFDHLCDHKEAGTAYPDTADTITVGATASSVIWGADGNDVITGSAIGDLIYGGDGVDTINGGAGEDEIYGEGGGDVIHGGDDPDTIIGDYSDYPSAAGGVDQLHGDGGFDLILGDEEGDVLNGGDDGAEMWGGLGDDTITGGSVYNLIFGGDGSDTVYGGPDADDIYGEGGGDSIHGGDGDDIIEGDYTDYPSDPAGADHIYGDGGYDTIWGDEEGDQLHAGADGGEMWGGDGNDTMWGGDGADELYGDDGDDTLVGGDGVDNLYGDDGLELHGTDGDDILCDSSLDDWYYGEGGSDTIVHDIQADPVTGDWINPPVYSNVGPGDDDTCADFEHDQIGMGVMPFGEGPDMSDFPAGVCENVVDVSTLLPLCPAETP